MIASLWIWEKFVRPLPNRTWLVVIALLLFAAFFNAWREEYVKTRPGLFLLDVRAGVIAVEPHKSSRILVFASVANRGAPTIADSWILRVKLVGQKEWSTFRPVMFDTPTITLSLGDLNNSPNVVYSTDDAIYLKAASNPIATGGKITGFIAFMFPAISKENALEKGAQYELECRDVSGNSIVGRFEMVAGPAEIPYLPGLHPPTIRNPSKEK